MLGGGVPNVSFQLGVCDALIDWGFQLSTGTLEDGESRSYGGRTINPVVGSSSGAFAAVCASMGYDADDLIGRTDRIQPIDESIIKDPIDTGLWAMLKRLFTSREKYTRLKKLVHSHPARYEHFINTYYPTWKMDALENYIRDVLLDGHDFAELKAQLFILSVAQEQRLTFIFGERSEPRNPEDDFKFQNGVPLWKAVAGSMSLPPFYRPYRLENPPEEMKPSGGDSVVLVDGEMRDPFSTDVAQDARADLIIVSSFYRVLEYTPELGHIDDYGIIPVILQTRAHGKDAQKHQSILHRNRRLEALELVREMAETHCEDRAEEMVESVEKALDIRDELDVIEIQAQDYEHEELTYPYWDPFTLDEKVGDIQYDAGYELTQKKLRETIQPID
jgi:predicted acylesterase/phospholipase RssA